MRLLTAKGISIGIMAGVWAALCSGTGMLLWVGIVSWAAFYAAGGRLNGLKTTVAANIAGVIWGLICLQLVNGLQAFTGEATAYFISFGIIAAAICWQGYYSLLSFIPSAFVGFATYFATHDAQATLIALIIGAFFGYVSEWAAILLSNNKEFAGQKKL